MTMIDNDGAMAKALGELMSLRGGKPWGREYVSPSGLDLFEKDKEAFYFRYIAANKGPQEQQTLPMAVGNCFDSFCKEAIMAVRPFGAVNGLIVPQTHGDLWKGVDKGAATDDASVLAVAKLIWHCYKGSGAFQRLLEDIDYLVAVEERVNWTFDSGVAAAPIVTAMGYPDLSYVSKDGRLVMMDWKVSGSGAASVARPEAGWEYGVTHDGAPVVRSGRMKPWGMSIPKKWQMQSETYCQALAQKLGEGWLGAERVIHQVSMSRDTLPEFYQHRLPAGGTLEGLGDLAERYRACWAFVWGGCAGIVDSFSFDGWDATRCAGLERITAGDTGDEFEDGLAAMERREL